MDQNTVRLNRAAEAVARSLGPGTPYEEARRALVAALEGPGKPPPFDRSLDVQAMLVHQDPAVPSILAAVPATATFKAVLRAVNDHPWGASKPHRQRLGRRQYMFANRRAAAIFCYHKDVVARWKGAKGAPKNAKVSTKQWAFEQDLETPHVRMELRDGTSVYLFQEVPDGVPWGDLEMDTDEDA